MAKEIEFNPAKFKELMLYAAQECENDRFFGKTKLNKILFFSDFLSFGLRGESITGAKYIKHKHGPVPEEFDAMAQEVEDEGSGVFVERPIFNYSQLRLVPKRRANPVYFGPEELDLINDVIRALSSSTAEEVSRLSHDRSAAWQIASLGEEIPYEAVFLSARDASPRDIERGQELARKYGWLVSPEK